MYLDKTRFHFKSIILDPTSNEPVLLILYFFIYDRDYKRTMYWSFYVIDSTDGNGQ